MSERSVSAFFDSYATEFDAIYGTRNTLANRFVNRHFRKSMRLRYDRTLAGCEPVEGCTVLDIGCGPGLHAVELARRGAARVVGVDFADNMLDVARQRADECGVADRCEWVLGDFLEYRSDVPFDNAIVMGFMDYAADPARVIELVLSFARRRAFFSFPLAGGFLAWQRQLRYRRRCELYLYTRDRVRELFAEATDARVEIDTISRDLFVTVHLAES